MTDVGGSAQLQAFTVDHAELVSSWARTSEEVAAWCSRSEAPVPPDVIAGWSRQPDVGSYLLVDAGHPVGYGELWIDDDEAEVELAHLIIDPARRGQHLGRLLAGSLAAEGHRVHPTVFLRLVPGNAAALASYRAAGFERVDPAVEQEWNEGQPTAYVWMAHRPG